MINNKRNKDIPWVEKYRPTEFDDIVLDDTNKRIFKSIIENDYFPNLLFYGPPGTGKTTTIINLIHKYQNKLNQRSNDLIIHLNASDERGVDVVRNQINQFVFSKTMFIQGLKFVILDEVDYMTKPAQQILKYLIKEQSDVRFCLICNYISRVDDGLQSNFVKLRFDQLPPSQISTFIQKIAIMENLQLDNSVFTKIQQVYKSDIRSMINYLQSNQGIYLINIPGNNIWESMYQSFIDTPHMSNIDMRNNITELSIRHNIDKRSIIRDFATYIIYNKERVVTSPFISIVESIINSTSDINDLIDYMNFQFKLLLPLSKNSKESFELNF